MLKIEILKRRNKIDALIRNGDLVTIASIRRWLSENGVNYNSRKHFNNVLKYIFPEYVIGNRWSPTDVMIKEKVNGTYREHPFSENKDKGSRKNEDTYVRPLKKPTPSKEKKGGVPKDGKAKKIETDNKPLRVFENGLELDEYALNYIGEDMLMNSSEMIVNAFISQNSSGREYIEMKMNELEAKNKEKK